MKNGKVLFKMNERIRTETKTIGESELSESGAPRKVCESESIIICNN